MLLIERRFLHPRLAVMMPGIEAHPGAAKALDAVRYQ